MKICLVTVPTVVLIAVALTTYTCSGESIANVIEDNDRFNSVVPYDPGVTLNNVAIGPRLPEYGQIAAGDQPDHLDEVSTKLEPQPPTQLTKVEGPIDKNRDENKSTVLSDVSLDDGNSIMNRLNNAKDNTNSVGNSEPVKHENNHYFNDGKFVFAGETSDKSFKEDIEAYDDETENNPETPGDNSESNTNNTVVEVTIEDESKKDTEKGKEPKRSARYRKIPQNSEEEASPKFAGGYPGYSGYPSSPNAGFPGYPMPGYPMVTYSYPIYPVPPVPPMPGLLHPGYDDWYPTYPGSPKPPTYPTPDQGEPPEFLPPSSTRYPETVYPIPVGGQGVKPSVYDYPGYYPSYSSAGYSPHRYPVGMHVPYSVSGRYPHRPGSRHPPGHQRVPVVTARRPTSIPQRAMTAVSDALKSIAIFDDQQCVPRLLCEVAGGRAASSPTLLKAMSSLQPLLTILQSYTDVNTTSPLFIFGRAAVLGVTSKGNPAICRYAYPNCPNDPEKLVSYLNNHNGGFFRFFGQPDSPQQQQNLEQFYNHLSGTLTKTNINRKANSAVQSRKVADSDTSHSSYVPTVYKGHSSYRNIKDIEGTSEPRIQNKPIVNIKSSEEDDKFVERKGRGGSKWLFPDEVTNRYESSTKTPDRLRGGRKMRFPDEATDNREAVNIQDYIKDHQYYYQNDNQNDEVSTPANLDDYEYDHEHKFYVKKPKALKDDGKTVYIVRGNGDPNHPEVVKIQPGQFALK